LFVVIIIVVVVVVVCCSQDPAVNGTMNAMKAASDAGIKLVVLTSSMAAVTDEPIKGKVFDENDWNQKSTLSRNPYYLSKTLAERAAWKFVEELPADKKMKLVVINVSVSPTALLFQQRHQHHNDINENLLFFHTKQ